MPIPPFLQKPTTTLRSIQGIMSHNNRIEVALADLELQEVPNYSMTAKKYGVVRTILMRRFMGKTISNHEANTES